MGQLFALVVVVVLPIALWIRRGRAMAQIVADGEDEAPVAACTVVGGTALYDEVRWLRIALEEEGSSAAGGSRISVGVTAGGLSVGMRTSSRAGGQPVGRHAHAANLAHALASLPEDGRGVLRARGIDGALASLATRAAEPMAAQQRTQMLAELRHIEAQLTAAA